jgi:hypothetical protein
MNKKSLALAAAAAVLLSACAHHRMAGTPPFDPENPRVYVIDGKQIVVDQEPIFIRKKDVTIVWQLPQEYTFPSDGIVIEEKGRSEFRCSLREYRQQFQCVFRNSTPGARYKYTINVESAGTRLRPLDPYIFGDF